MKWEERPLGEVLVQNTEYVTTLEERLYPKLSVRLYGRGVELDRAVDGASVLMKKHQLAKGGQVIVSEIWAKKGAVGFVPAQGEGALITSHFFLFDVLTEKVDPRWLHHLFRGNYLASSLSDGAKGTTSKAAIRPHVFLKAAIPLPPVDEQRRIVVKLDAAAERVARIEATQSANAEDFDRALQSHFASTLPHAKWMRMSEVAPLSWRQIQIEPEKNYTEFGVRSFFKGIFRRREVPGTAFSWQELYRLQTGDIVFSNIMAWEKAIAVARPEHEGWVGNHRMLTCEPNREFVTPSYLHHYFTTPGGFDKILRASPGTAARNKTLKADDLMAIEVPVPPLTQQRAFDALCEKFARLRAAQQSRTTELAALMPSLLDKAFKRQLRSDQN